MRKILMLVSAAALSSLAVTQAASADEILYTESGTVSGFYFGPFGTGAFSNVAATVSFVGDTSQTGVAYGPSQSGGAPYYNTVGLTYGYAQIGGFSGDLDGNYFDSAPNVFALSNSNAPYPVRIGAVTEVDPSEHLEPGGFSYSDSPALLTWDGVSDLPSTSYTPIDPGDGGIDLAFKNGVLISFTSETNTFLSATVLTGASASDAFLPNAPDGTGYGFSFEAAAGETDYFDPAVAIGYDYAVGVGSPLITKAIFPDIAGSDYEIFALTDLSHPLPVTFVDGPDGESVDFTSLPGYADGIDGFRLLGINPAAGLDPHNATDFVTGLTFATSGAAFLSQTPIALPEPGAWATMLLGVFGLGARLRNRRARLA